MGTTLRTTIAVCTLGVVVAACAADDGDAEQATSDAPGTTIAVAETDLGDVVVDGDGMTLYLFDPDERGPSRCEDDCAVTWPPVITDGPPGSGDGIDDASIGTTDRDDGTQQVTYDGWPLYLLVGDQAPGDVTGQAVDDEWWVLAPDGTPQRDGAAAVETDDASGGRDGY